MKRYLLLLLTVPIWATATDYECTQRGGTIICTNRGEVVNAYSTHNGNSTVQLTPPAPKYSARAAEKAALVEKCATAEWGHEPARLAACAAARMIGPGPMDADQEQEMFKRCAAGSGAACQAERIVNSEPHRTCTTSSGVTTCN